MKIYRIGVGILLGASLWSGAQPARAQFYDNMGYGHNNMESALIGTWLNGQSSMMYTRQQLYHTMARGGSSRPSAAQLQERRGKAVIRRRGATMRFAMRPFPIGTYMKTSWNGDAATRKRSYNEWMAQRVIWQQEAKARGAQFGDMAEMYALAMVACHEAYTGRRVTNAGFRLMVRDFRDAFLKWADYQGRTVTSKQQFYETAMLTGSYVLYLRRSGDIAKARQKSQEFLDEWWTEDTPGVVKTLAPYTTKSQTRTVAAPRRPNSAPVIRAAMHAPAASPAQPTASPAMLLAQATQVSNFKPVPDSLIATKFAAQVDEKDRPAAENLSQNLINAARREMLAQFASDLPENNVARAMSFGTMTLYAIVKTRPGGQIGDGMPPFSKAQVKALQEQFTLVLANNAAFRRLSDSQKQEAYETFLLLPAMSGLLYSTGVQKNSAPAQERARQNARENLQRIFGVAPEKMRFTDDGLVIG